MFVNKTKLRKKMLKEIEEYKEQGYHYCCICRDKITKQDIKGLDFEYVKNKLGETYAHSFCVEFRKIERM